MKRSYSEITPYIAQLAQSSTERNHIQPDMYEDHKVYRGLRDRRGRGVVTGLTEISTVNAQRMGG